MEALSVREYRNNLAASFTKADNGEQVLIRRKNEIYALVKVGREDLMITPELQARIELQISAYRHAAGNAADFDSGGFYQLADIHRGRLAFQA